MHGKVLKFLYDNAKSSFYRSFNALFQKIAACNNEILLVYLLKSICLPALLYAAEATSNINDKLNSLDRCVYLALSKIFNTYSNEIISAVRIYFDIPSVKSIVDRRRESYLMSLVENEHFKALFQSGGLWLL